MRVVKILLVLAVFSFVFTGCAENDINNEHSLQETADQTNNHIKQQDEKISEELRIQRRQMQQRKSQPPERIYRF